MTDVHLTEEAATRVRTRFRTTSEDLTGAREDLAGLPTELATGAGEFAAELADGSTDFDGSWRAAYEVLGDAAALIAGNTNALYVDLSALDDGA